MLLVHECSVVCLHVLECCSDVGLAMHHCLFCVALVGTYDATAPLLHLRHMHPPLNFSRLTTLGTDEPNGSLLVCLDGFCTHSAGI